MQFIISLLILLLCIDANGQVRVRGYYRKNGTYVQPYYRTKPDGNPYNNYSYPGNSNPNTGNTTKISSNVSAAKRITPVPSNYKYKGYIKGLGNPPLRESPSINGKEIFQCEKGDEVYVLDNTGDLYYKVDVNGMIGYLSRSFISETNPTQIIQIKPIESTVNIKTNNLNYYDSSYMPMSGTYQYQTTIKARYEPPLRDTPSINGKVIYNCPLVAKIYVIEKGALYYKVNISGNIGFLSRSYIKED